MSFRNQTEIPFSFQTDDAFVGLLYTIVSILCCCFQLIMLHVLYFDADLRRVPAYSIMFHLGLADVVQLIFHTFSGIFVVFQTTFHPWLEKICGALINTGCVVYTPLTMLLAINRFVVICCPPNMQSPLFSIQTTKIWITLIWLYGCCFFLCYISPLVTVFFDPSIYMWGHVGRLAKFIHDAEFYAALIELCVTTILYMAVVLALVSKRRFVSITRSSLQHCELRILIQAMTISFFIGFVLFTWYNFDSFFIQTKWTFFLVNMMWILNCGINPILYLVLNRTIRRKYAIFFNRYFGCNFKSATSDLSAQSTTKQMVAIYDNINKISTNRPRMFTIINIKPQLWDKLDFSSCIVATRLLNTQPKVLLEHSVSHCTI